MAMLRLWRPATVALLLSLSGGTVPPGRIEAVPRETTAHRAHGAADSAPRGASQRTADRVIARRLRRAIRADSFLALATPAVKVTCHRRVLRLVGQVRTGKERSSIAFKAGQIAGVERIDDRLTIANAVEGTAW
jgi:osmotically-inducible protein OsmY